jgi:hypothetical protein
MNKFLWEQMQESRLLLRIFIAITQENPPRSFVRTKNKTVFSFHYFDLISFL